MPALWWYEPATVITAKAFAAPLLGQSIFITDLRQGHHHYGGAPLAAQLTSAVIRWFIGRKIW